MTHQSILEIAPEDTFKTIAQQLSCPTGEEGVKMGQTMNASNKDMIKESILSLNLSYKNRVLELGHGNCSHLIDIMAQAEDLRYFGMEISKVMQQEAERINSKYTKVNHALFDIYDGHNIPYVPSFFNKILTVNTIYFWKNPLPYLNEIYRVLKPNGICIISFVKSSFMQSLPFVTDNLFNLYDNEKLKVILRQTDFELVGIDNKTERVKNKIGDWVNREYSIFKLSK